MSSSKCLQNKLEYRRRMKNIQSANIKWHTRIFKNVYLQQFAIISVCGMRSVCCLTMFYLPIWWTWWCGSRANVPCMYQYSLVLYLLNTVFLTTCPVYNEHACILRQDKKSTRLLPFAWTCNKAAFTGNICMLIYYSFIKFLKFYWLIEIFD